MNAKEGEKLALDLIKRVPSVVLSTIDEEGFPEARAMLNLGSEDFTIWFTTNTSSRKVQQIKNSGKASAYFFLPDEWRGLTLIGEIRIIEDRGIKKKLWQEGWRAYYPGGVDDPDYTILCLKPKKAHYYHKLDRVSFEI